MRQLELRMKRLIDIIGSLVGITLFSPIFLLVILAIKGTSRGPVFFLQERLGLHGEVFRIIKFRSMVVNAEHMGEGLRVKSSGDQRITRVGKILRATSMDELPQFFNVLKGDMSLVGPRPPVVYYPYDGYENYPDWGKKRFEMKPGITGYAQVKVRNSASWDHRIRLDLRYVENFSILFDIKILMATVIKVFRTNHVYMGEMEGKKGEN